MGFAQMLGDHQIEVVAERFGCAEPEHHLRRRIPALDDAFSIGVDERFGHLLDDRVVQGIFNGHRVAVPIRQP